MGFDCYYLDPQGVVQDHFYLSYNFSPFRVIRYDPELYPEAKPFEGEKRIFYIGWAYGHTGRVVARMVELALEQLRSIGIEPEIRANETAWTANLRVFAYHLVRLLELSRQHSDCVFDADYYNGAEDYIDPYDSEYNEEVQEIPDEITFDDTRVYTVYRHPQKGQVEITDFASAIEAYSIAVKENSPMAKGFYELALKTHDCPAYLKS